MENEPKTPDSPLENLSESPPADHQKQLQTASDNLFASHQLSAPVNPDTALYDDEDEDE